MQPKIDYNVRKDEIIFQIERICMILGSHLSIAGGVFNAIASANELGFKALAVFVRNQRRWAAKPLDQKTIDRFREDREKSGIKYVVAHASYLANLGSDNPESREKSLNAVVDDLNRCQLLGIEYLVLHPGSNKNLEHGIEYIAEGLNKAEKLADSPDVKLLLETTAGQGNCIGHRFEHIGDILKKLKHPEKFGVCLDTCHIFAAGYDFSTPKAYKETFKQFGDAIGIENLLAIHCNDSLKDLGSRVDRHAHIGKGKIGVEAFSLLVNDKKLRDLPFILETPKDTDESGRDMDLVNADLLNSLIK